MAVSWASRIARLESRQACGHPQCRRYTIASAVLIGSAVVAEFGLAVATAGSGNPLPVVAGGALFTAGLVLAFWPHPHDDGGIEALIEATREPVPDYFPHEWTEEYKQ